MANASELLGAFSQARDDQQRRAQRATVASRVATIVMLLAIVAICIVALRQLWIGWQTASSDSWLFSLFLVPALGILLTILRLQSQFAEEAESSALRQRVQVVRRALLAGDTRVAPLATEQPEPAGRVPTGDESLLVGPLRPLTDSQLKGTDLAGIAFILIGFCIGVLAVAFTILSLTQPHAPNNPPLWVAAALIALTVVLLGIGIRLIVPSLRGRRPRPLVVDALGVHWARRLAGSLPLLWGDVRAFYTITAHGLHGELPYYRICVLDGSEQVIAWRLRDGRFDRTRSASDQLAGMIVSRTGLPLRDLTLAFERTMGPVRRLPEAVRASQSRMLAQIEAARERGLNPRAEARMTALIGKLMPPDPAYAEDVSEAVRQALEAAGLPAAPPKSAARAGCTLLLAAFIAFALLAGASWGLQQLQPRYLASLPAQIHAETPLYADSLAAPGGTWLVSGTAANGVQYQDQTYRLTGTAGNAVTAWAPVSYGDVAVQVTARQLGGTQSDGIGLIVRADPAGDDYVAFVVSPTDGSWTLWQYHPIDANPDDNWHYLAGGDCGTIHRGSGVANTLLAITRGQTYVLYVNGVFVGSASDGDTDVYGSAPTIGTMTTPQQGYAGVYLADGVTTGVFSDFAVYRVRPPSSLWYV